MPKPNKICPVCKSKETREDYDFSKTMRVCKKCGSEWNCYDEILFNAKEDWISR